MKKTKKVKLSTFAILSIAATAMTARAAVIDLTFEGIAPYPNGNDVMIENFYNGGTSSIGTSGTNYGNFRSLHRFR